MTTENTTTNPLHEKIAVSLTREQWAVLLNWFGAVADTNFLTLDLTDEHTKADMQSVSIAADLFGSELFNAMTEEQRKSLPKMQDLIEAYSLDLMAAAVVPNETIH